MNSHHILSLQENDLGGNDYIIADIHGDNTSFSENLQKLNPEDRLFVVGDLTDRGPDSANVMRLIFYYQTMRPERLFVIRGNHESACLRTIAALEDMIDLFKEIPYSPDNVQPLNEWINKTKNDEHTYQGFKVLKSHLRDGGEWLVKLYKHEIYNGDITLHAMDQSASESDSSGDEAASEVIYEDSSLIKKIKDFMAALPYVIYVEGDHPFLLVHADMPVDEETLKRRILQGTGLTQDEIRYATNARPPGSDKVVTITDAHRNRDSIVAYTGHNIILYGKAAVIRYNTNTVNLDVAAYKTRVALRVNHTRGECDYVGVNVDDSMNNFPQLKPIQEELQKHLDIIFKKRSMFHVSGENENIAFGMRIPEIKRVIATNQEVPVPLSPSKRENMLTQKRERISDLNDEFGVSARSASEINISPMKRPHTLFSSPSGILSRHNMGEDKLLQESVKLSPAKKIDF